MAKAFYQCSQGQAYLHIYCLVQRSANLFYSKLDNIIMSIFSSADHTVCVMTTPFTVVGKIKHHVDKQTCLCFSKTYFIRADQEPDFTKD